MQTSVRMTYSFLKAYWNAFLTPLHTTSTRKWQENAANGENLIFSYAAVTCKQHPVFMKGHMYILTRYRQK